MLPLLLWSFCDRSHCSYARPGLKNVHAGMHIADSDDFIDIHMIMAANLRQLIGEGDVDRAEEIGRAHV